MLSCVAALTASMAIGVAPDLGCASPVVKEFSGPIGTGRLGPMELTSSLSIEATWRLTEHSRWARIADIGSDTRLDNVVLSQFQLTGRVYFGVGRPGLPPRFIVTTASLPLNTDVNVRAELISTDGTSATGRVYFDNVLQAEGQLWVPRPAARDALIGRSYWPDQLPRGTMSNFRLQYCPVQVSTTLGCTPELIASVPSVTREARPLEQLAFGGALVMQARVNFDVLTPGAQLMEVGNGRESSNILVAREAGSRRLFVQVSNSAAGTPVVCSKQLQPGVTYAVRVEILRRDASTTWAALFVDGRRCGEGQVDAVPEVARSQNFVGGNTNLPNVLLQGSVSDFTLHACPVSSP